VLADYPALFRDVSRGVITPEQAQMMAEGKIEPIGGLRKYGELPSEKQIKSSKQLDRE